MFHEREYAQTLRGLFRAGGSPTRYVSKTIQALDKLLQHAWVLRIVS